MQTHQKENLILFSQDGSKDPDIHQTIDYQLFGQVGAIQGFIDSRGILIG